MQYYALVNTGSPATGFIAVGEVLTEKQAAALGPEKIAELVREKVLAPGREEAPAQGEAPAQEEAPTGEEAPEAEPGSEAASGEEEDEGEELPELEITEEIVRDPAEEAPAEPKKGGRRKAK